MTDLKIDAMTERALSLLSARVQRRIRAAMERDEPSSDYFGPYLPPTSARRAHPMWRGIDFIEIRIDPVDGVQSSVYFILPDPGWAAATEGALVWNQPIPHTIAAALPGRPANAIMDHPLVDGLSIMVCVTDAESTSAMLRDDAGPLGDVDRL